MAVTLKTIAERAHVSVMAVSAALNNTTGTRLSAEKRAYIRQIAAEMGYRPNLIAQRLSGGKSHLIGVVIDSYMNSSSALMLRGIEEEAAKRNYRILVAEQHESMSGISEIFRIFEQYGSDGAICLSHDYKGEEEALKEIFSGMKNIVLWERSAAIDAPYVCMDVQEAFRRLVNGWKSTGRKKAALVMNTDFNQQMIDRCDLFKEVCGEYGLTPVTVKVDAQPADKNIFPLMQQALLHDLLPGKVDCVLAENDIWACSLIGAATKNGVGIPEDIAVTGWDNEPFCCGLVPPLASISINAEEIGRKMVQLLCESLDGRTVTHVAVPADFYCRESCGFSQ